MLTAADHERRRNYLGSSEVATIFGVSPFKRNAADIAMIKRGEINEADLPSTEDQRAGTYLEDGIGRWACDRLKAWVVGSQYWEASDQWPFAAATIDFLVGFQGPVANPSILECKLVGREHADEWGHPDDGLDGVPIYYLVQAVWQLGVTGCQTAYVAACIAGFGHELRIYRIDRDEAMVEQTMEAGRRWWEKHVIAGEPVPMLPSLDFAIRRKREPGKVIDVADATVFEFWENRRQERLRSEKLEQEALTKALCVLGDADVARTPDGCFEFKANKRGARTPRWVERGDE